MSRPKMHAKWPLPYETIGLHLTLCNKHVEGNQIASFESGVTCKNCQNMLEFQREQDAERAARKAGRG